MIEELKKNLENEKRIIEEMGFIDAQLGDLENALSKAEKALFKNPADSYLYFVLGKAALTQSQLALGDRLVSIGRKVGVAGSWVSVLEGRIALRRRDFSKAVYCFSHALSYPRTDPWAYYFLGTTYMRMGELPEAINALYAGDQYLADNPQMRGRSRNAIRAKLGIVYVLNNDLNAASIILENLIKEDPKSPGQLVTVAGHASCNT